MRHTPYSEAAAAAAGITTDLRLKKLNGASVTVTKEAQYNAAVMVTTIRNANWPGVSAADKDRLALIALITMAQESTFYTNASALNPDENEDAGPFQQRTKVGWYADGATQAENVQILQSIPYATLTFIEGHKVAVKASGGAGPVGYRIPGVFAKKEWRTAEPWRTSVAVQVPAKWTYPMSEAWTPVAQALLAAIDGTVMSVDGGSNLAGCWGGGNAQFTTGTLSLVEPGPWGGHSSGDIPSGLCDARVAGRSVQLRCDAAKSLEVLAEEYKRFGNGAGEVRLAAGPNGYLSRIDQTQAGGGFHAAFGWGLAVRLDPGSPAFAWVVEHQDTSSWRQPADTRAKDPGLFLYYAVAGPQAEGWEVGLKPATVNIGRYVKANYEQITTIGGHRRDTPNDHPSGRAIDIMIPDYKSTEGRDLGDRMAADLRSRATQLGIQYIIWDGHIWNVARDGEGWRHMADRGSDSANHYDHLHVNTW